MTVSAGIVIIIGSASAAAERFMVRYPHIKVTLLASNDAIDFKRQDIDVAIRWGNASWQADVQADLMISDYHFPVCSPAYRDEQCLLIPQDLSKATILHEVNGSPWAGWFEAANCGQPAFRDILYFSDAGLMLEAATQDQGVCLTNYVLAEKDLMAGRLVKLFDVAISLRTEGYYLLTNAALAGRPAITCLLDWLRQEAQKTVIQQLMPASASEDLS
jgi:LysR family transcriptional regulator, glycine cleavage system transcriptional activator